MKVLARCAAAVAALAGGLAATNAGAVNIATDGVGEVAIAPYYTTRNNWSTLVTVTNTRNVPIVVKVRVHEGRNSRDVLDFNVALSAFDVFTGVIRESASVDPNVGTTRPVFVALDQPDQLGRRTCTIPNRGNGEERPFRPLAFGPPGTTDDDGGPTGVTPTNDNPFGDDADSVDRMREGYVEFIVMGYADGETSIDDGNSDPADGTIGNVGSLIESHNCDTLETAFTRANIPTTAQQFGEPLNALKFNFSLINPDFGLEAGQQALTLANFYNPAGDPQAGSPVATAPGPMGAVFPTVTPAMNAACTIDRGEERRVAGTNWDPSGTDGASCLNLITAQDTPDFLEPSLNDAYPPVANYWDDERNFPAYARPTTTIATPAADGQAFAAVETQRGVDAVSLLLQRAAIINEWSNNPGGGVITDWIVTLPTKGFYVDGGATANSAPLGNNGPGLQSAIVPGGIGNQYTPTTGGNFVDGGRDETVLAGLSVPYPPFAQAFGQQLPDGTPIGTTGVDSTSMTPDSTRNEARACNQVGVSVYDRAEQSRANDNPGGVIDSPAPPPVVDTLNLCYEANVVTFGGQSALDSAYPLLNTDGSPSTVDTSGLAKNDGTPNLAGWAQLRLDVDDAANLGAVQVGGPFMGQTGGSLGLPVTGFVLKTRAFSGATGNNQNYASSVEHAYLRAYSETSVTGPQ